MVAKRFVPHLEAILNDPDASFWETDGALWALAAAGPEDIRRNRGHIDRWAQSDEWYLRESSYWALVGLGTDISGQEFLELSQRYNRSVSVFERKSMNSGIGHLVRKVRVDLDDEVVARYVQTVASQLYDARVASGYDQFAAGQEAAHRTLMVIKDFKDPPYRLISKQLAKYLEGWEPNHNQHANWLVTGNKWQPGLAKIAIDMGKDAGPIIAQFERCLQRKDWDLKPGKRNPQLAVYEAMQRAVAHYKGLQQGVDP